MFDALCNWLLDNYPILFFSAVIIAIAIIIIRKYYKFKYSEFNPLRKDVDIILTDNSNINKNIENINTNITTIKACILMVAKDKTAVKVLLQTNSPYSLSPFGEEILKTSGAKKAVDDNLSLLISDIEKEKPLTALDVENKSSEILLKNSNTDIFKEIKDFIFNNPKYKSIDLNLAEIDLDLSIFITIMGIYLRDKYLSAHPEITFDSGSGSGK